MATATQMRAVVMEPIVPETAPDSLRAYVANYLGQRQDKNQVEMSEDEDEDEEKEGACVNRLNDE